MGTDQDDARREIAARAAAYIADSGLDYAAAKQRAARDLYGGRVPRGVLPDNDDVDEALREHLALFDDEHPQRVATMRAVALDLMRRLEHFHPLVTGAAWKGIAAAHAPLHLQLFADNPKEVEYWLLDQRVDYEFTSMTRFNGPGEVDALALLWRDQPVLLSLYDPLDLRGALRGGADAQRGDRAALAARCPAGES